MENRAAAEAYLDYSSSAAAAVESESLRRSWQRRSNFEPERPRNFELSRNNPRIAARVMKMSVNGGGATVSASTVGGPPPPSPVVLNGVGAVPSSTATGSSTATSTSQPQSPQHNQTSPPPLPLGHNGPLWDVGGGGIGGGGGSGAPSLTSLSRLNSMECWDYTIELECLRGPEGKGFVWV